MINPLRIDIRNAVLHQMGQSLRVREAEILEANSRDVQGYKGEDTAMRERLPLTASKIADMCSSLERLLASPDPLGVERYHFRHENGMEISDRTAPFGTVLIIYESRPDVTIEAAGIAFKSGNRILLKGGKEALHTNQFLAGLWQEALRASDADTQWVRYLNLNREQTQAFLKEPPEKIDLIVPRGGEQLIDFVRSHAKCPVIVSGRGNNFLYIDREANLDMALNIVLNAKTTRISACNALDKVLIHKGIPDRQAYLFHLIGKLNAAGVEVFTDPNLGEQQGAVTIGDHELWKEEFLDLKILLGEVGGIQEAMEMINTYGGGHSTTIISENPLSAAEFMQGVDSAAVYHNASTRFTDGGQFGLGAELAISTDKLHHRGPLGLQHLTTNKWFIRGNGNLRT